MSDKGENAIRDMSDDDEGILEDQEFLTILAETILSVNDFLSTRDDCLEFTKQLSEKLLSLEETVSFASLEEWQKKLNLLKKTYLENKSTVFTSLPRSEERRQFSCISRTDIYEINSVQKLILLRVKQSPKEDSTKGTDSVGEQDSTAGDHQRTIQDQSLLDNDDTRISEAVKKLIQETVFSAIASLQPQSRNDHQQQQHKQTHVSTALDNSTNFSPSHSNVNDVFELNLNTPVCTPSNESQTPRSEDRLVCEPRQLKETYGGSYMQAQSLLKKALQWPPVKGSSSMKEFVSFLNKVKAQKSLNKHLDYVDSESFNKTMCKKVLPHYLTTKWFQFVAEHYDLNEIGFPNFNIFLKFMERQTVVECMKESIFEGDASKKKTGRKSRNNSRPRSKQHSSDSHASQSVRENTKKQFKCYFCSEPHKIWQCDAFKSKTSEKRKKFVETK